MHVSKKAPTDCLENARNAMALFASTSPSYLILQSLDVCNRYLADGYQEQLDRLITRLKDIRHTLRHQGLELVEGEPLKLVLHAAAFGYTGDELAAYLRTHQIECEFSDGTYLVCMATPQNTDEELQRLTDALLALPVRPSLPLDKALSPTPHTAAMTVREAILSPCESVEIESAVGRILATPTVSCPPAIPIVISGERITAEDVKLFLQYGIDRVTVVKEKHL